MMMMMVGDVIIPHVRPSVHDKVYECDRKRSSSHRLSLDVAQLQNNQQKYVREHKSPLQPSGRIVDALPKQYGRLSVRSTTNNLQTILGHSSSPNLDHKISE